MKPAVRQLLFGAQWTPTRLFNGAPGDVYDGLAPLYQDSTGTTLVTAASDPVGRFPGLVNGNHLIQATAAARGTCVIRGTARGVAFNGTSQFLAAAGVNFTGCTKATIVLGLRQAASSTTAGVVLEAGSPSGDGGFATYVNNTNPEGAFGGGVGNGAATNYVFNNSASTKAAPSTYVASAVFDPAAGTSADRCRLRIDGADMVEYLASSSGTPTTSAFGSKTVTMGARVGGAVFSNIEVYAAIIIGRELTTTELQRAEQWCASRAGVSLPSDVGLSYTPSTWSDTGTTSDAGTYTLTSPFARAVFTTGATRIEVESENNIFGTFPTLTEIGVYVDGSYYGSIAAAASGTSTCGLTLPVGGKTVAFVNGAQSKPAGTLLGTFIKKLRANSAMEASAASASNRLVVYGDSISVGANSTHPTKNAWGMICRGVYPGSWAHEGWGSRALFDDCNTAGLRAAFVSTLVAYNPSKLWIAIGTNDYGLSKWTAAAFGTAYAALLDDLNTALPSLVIYCQTPIPRSSEVANAVGSTLANYRTQIATAQSTRSSYCTLVDGTTFLTYPTNYDDTVHPNTAGHLQYANAVRAVLGV